MASSAISKATLLELASSATLKATLLELASANRSESQKATMSVLELANQWVYLLVPLMEEESAMTFPMGLGSATTFLMELELATSPLLAPYSATLHPLVT